MVFLLIPGAVNGTHPLTPRPSAVMTKPLCTHLLLEIPCGQPESPFCLQAGAWNSTSWLGLGYSPTIRLPSGLSWSSKSTSKSCFCHWVGPICWNCFHPFTTGAIGLPCTTSQNSALYWSQSPGSGRCCQSPGDFAPPFSPSKSQIKVIHQSKPHISSPVDRVPPKLGLQLGAHHHVERGISHPVSMSKSSCSLNVQCVTWCAWQ